ncbi:esterase LipI-like isoform X6 [Dreissena polymorpha]|uniref:esterase LipI-like isoform X6 n=2 Tax=Dreissena polymorpha TaxID=45954 RepID=UPI002263C226|nr:esterase LipI-like isoform X6 [Dreissena polymorpha]
MSFNVEEFINVYKPNKETVDYLRAKYTGDFKAFDDDVEAARQAAVDTATKFAGTATLDGKETELFVPSEHVPDGIPVTVYTPEVCRQQGAPPTILVYFHGGGNVTKDRKTQATMAIRLATMVPCILVDVEYRRSPEHKFPASNEDAKSVVAWVAANKASLGGASSSKIGVSGDSNGGRLAAVMCYDLPVVVDFAVLIYPKVSYQDYPSCDEFKNGPLLPKVRMDWFSRLTLTEDDYRNPRASVVLQPDHSVMPPTLVLVAELDPLRDGALDYVKILTAAGVDVEMELIKGVPHTFWTLPGAFKENCQRSYERVAAFIRKQSLWTGWDDFCVALTHSHLYICKNIFLIFDTDSFFHPYMYTCI